MAIPNFDVLESHYPDYQNFKTPESVKALIGGETQEKDVTNTCAIRMSHALNHAGRKVPRMWDGIINRKGANGWYYILRVSNFRTWLEHVGGKPALDVKKESGRPFDRARIESMTGIIAFEIGFTDATGHFDLWNGDAFTHEAEAGSDYFVRASRISLWATSTVVLRAPV